MHIRKHLLQAAGLIFALYTLHYVTTLKHRVLLNYEHQKFQERPDLQSLHNLTLQKKIFIQYLTPIIVRQNKFLKKLHNRIIYLHRQFLKSHKLTPNQWHLLNFYYQHAIPFSIYKNKTWLKLLTKTAPAPDNIIMDFARQNFKIVNNKHAMKTDHNPFLLKTTPTYCLDPAYMLLGQNKPWTQLIDCYRPYHATLPMLKPDDLQYIQYSSLKAALEDYLWIVNTNPAYRQFREHRNPSHYLLNPDRLYEKKYYMMQS